MDAGQKVDPARDGRDEPVVPFAPARGVIVRPRKMRAERARAQRFYLVEATHDPVALGRPEPFRDAERLSIISKLRSRTHTTSPRSSSSLCACGV